MKAPQIRINITETANDFERYPSVAKAQQIEANIEGVSIDYGHFGSVSGKVHPILLEKETEEERRANPY